MSANSQNDFFWDDIRVLLAAFRSRTLTGAGVRLGVNASTVGRRLQALESALHSRLFERTADGLIPTAATEHLLERAEELERAAHSLGSAVHELETSPEGSVRISAPPGVAEHFLAPALPRLLSRHPELRIELDVSARFVDLARREADLALRAVLPRTGDLVAVKIADEQDRLFASAAYAAELGALRELADARWIGWDRDLADLPSARWLDERVPEAKVALRTSSVGAQVTAAEAGVGVVLLPASYGEGRPLAPVRLSGSLRASLPSTPRQELWMVAHRAARDVPRVAAVWETIVESRGLLGRKRNRREKSRR